MESRALNIILGLLGMPSFIRSYFSPENRIIGAIIGFALFILIFLSEQNEKIKDIESLEKKLEEKLKIYEQLINIKKDIDILKERINKNGKRKRY